MSKELNETQNATVGMTVGMIEVRKKSHHAHLFQDTTKANPFESILTSLSILSALYPFTMLIIYYY